MKEDVKLWKKILIVLAFLIVIATSVVIYFFVESHHRPASIDTADDTVNVALFSAINIIITSGGSWGFPNTILFYFENVRLNVGLNVRLSDTQKDMIDLLKDNPKLKAQDIAVLLNKSKKTIERNFIELQKNNIIERAGSKRNGYWIVIE